MRQYLWLQAQIKEMNKKKEKVQEQKKTFSYGMIKKVYTIVLMYKSTEEFHRFPEDYLHYAKQTFQTGLSVDLMQEYLLIRLDIFLKNNHTIISKLDAWLYFIASDKMEDIKKVCEAYPEFKELYQDVFKFRYQPKELVSMFSEALRLLDKATEQYMIDDLTRKNEKQREELEAKDRVIEEQRRELEQKKAEMERQKAEMEQQKAEMKTKDDLIRKLSAEQGARENRRCL